MAVILTFTLPVAPPVTEVRVYESLDSGVTYNLAYSEVATNATTYVMYPDGSSAQTYQLTYVAGTESAPFAPTAVTALTLPGTYIPFANTGNSRKDVIIDNYLSPRLEKFRQLQVYRGEQFGFARNPLRSTYKPWLAYAPVKVFRNALQVGNEADAGTLTLVNPETGTFSVDPVLERGETLMVTYQFDYFPDKLLSALIDTAMGIINAYEPASSYRVDIAPQSWDGMIAEQVYVLCLEKLILDNSIWEGRLIFASPEEVLSNLQSALEGARDRTTNLISTMKKIPYVSPPTWAYYDAIRMGGGRMSYHGMSVGYGRTRGIKINRWFGR